MQVQCRKCGGNHLTVKCGVESKSITPVNNTRLYKVSIKDLPVDITKPELTNLMEPWGPVSYIKLVKYKENSIAYIDFLSENHAKHFVNMLDKTPFDNMIIHVSCQ